MKNCIRPHYEKLKPLKSGFIENSIFENNRDPWNKLRPILKFKEYYPIEHIFAPACSSARKIHFFLSFSDFQTQSVISPKICHCIHPFFRNYGPVSTPSSYCIRYSVIKRYSDIVLYKMHIVHCWAAIT